MGILLGAPPSPGATEASAAILYACSGLSTSTIQYPARNSFDSGKTPSVIGVPSLLARTSLAWSGQPKPSVATYTPSSLSCLLKARMKATFASISFFDHLAYSPKWAFVPFIIRMYFIRRFSPFVFELSLPSHKIVEAPEAFSTWRYYDLAERLTIWRTSMGMFVGTPPGPGATEIREA